MSLKSIALRIGQAVLVIWATFTLSFILLAALPGDAVATRYDNPTLGLNAEQLAAIREVYGADEPLLSRYVSALGGFLTGDFGFSVATGTAVSEMLADALPSTLALAAALAPGMRDRGRDLRQHERRAHQRAMREATGKPGKLVEIDDTEKIFSNPTQKATEDYISGRFG